jgi:hypothetical protein
MTGLYVWAGAPILELAYILCLASAVLVTAYALAYALRRP